MKEATRIPVSEVPTGWDIRRDLVVLVGSDVEHEARAWLAAGQERLIVYVQENAETITLPHPAVVARSRTDVLQAILWFTGDPPQLVTLRKHDDAWATTALLTALGERIKECLHSRHLSLHTLCANGQQTLERCFLNADRIAQHPSIASLDDAFVGTPCVIVSPGPSLSKNIHLLEQLKGRALLMTGTHALASFRNAGVDPDFVVAADPGDLRRHVAGHDFSRVQAMVVAVTCRPENFENGGKSTFTFSGNPGSDDWIFEPFGEDARLLTGGSVACSAFSLAIRMGCDPIILVGQDLSFPGGRYYADGNLDGDARAVFEDDGRFYLRKPSETTDEYGTGRMEDGTFRFTLSRASVELAGYHGGTVPSSESFRAFLFWFETVIESFEGRPRVWNCTEGGARIAGAEQRTLADALSELPRRPALSTDELARELARRTADLSPNARGAKLEGFLDGLLVQLKRCQELAMRAKRFLPGAANGGPSMARFETVEAELSAAIKPLRLVALVAQRSIIDAAEAGRRAPNLEANLAASGRLIDIFQEAASFVRGPLEEALDRLRGAR